MRQPKDKTEQDGRPIRGRYLNRIAQEIATDCDDSLDVIVATHRHQDHISGFARSKGKGPGEIIRKLEPHLILQPWTEDPFAAEDATHPTRSLHVRTLAQMQTMAAEFTNLAKTLRGQHLQMLRTQIREIGMNNIANRDAVTNLKTMAKNRYVHYGRSAGLGRILPGVRVTVLGPPTVDQTNAILKQRGRDEDEFWHLNATYWNRLALTDRHHSDGAPLFPDHVSKKMPKSAGWFRYWMMRERAESMMSIVRSLDKAMNNTSLILLFEVNGKSLLFPGDAQYENWMYALQKESVIEKLRGVDLYKVGHHGSLNATPKTLWKGFDKKGGANQEQRLRSLLSTKQGVHGHEERNTEVPRKTLVNALKENSELTSTLDFAPHELSRSVRLEF